MGSGQQLQNQPQRPEEVWALGLRQGYKELYAAVLLSETQPLVMARLLRPRNAEKIARLRFQQLHDLGQIS